MDITLNGAAVLLKSVERVLILTHASPDGDTLGSAGALCLALRQLGKHARIMCNDEIPPKYSFMLQNIPDQDFVPEFVVTVDVADLKLLGKDYLEWEDKIDLSIDHHASNRHYAKYNAVIPVAANCENIYSLLAAMEIEMTEDIARCLYTGIITDTGCFRYSNVTPETHIIAANLMEVCPNTAQINLEMFEIKSRNRIALENAALSGISFLADGRCAMTVITREILEKTGTTVADVEGIASMTRNIEGVQIGFLIREKTDGTYKVSCRTCETSDAAELCGLFGGGGHPRAAGFSFAGTLEELFESLKEVSARFITEE